VNDSTASKLLNVTTITLFPWGTSDYKIAAMEVSRVLGITMEEVSDWRQPVPSGRWAAQFFFALAQRYDLIDIVQPTPIRRDRYLNQALAFRPNRSRWKAQANFNQFVLKKRTQAVQEGLERNLGSYDLIMQMQTLCDPGFDRSGTNYAIYTDNTMALTRQYYPSWAPLSSEGAAQWMRFEAEVCQSAAAVFTFSEFARRSMIEDYGCSPERVVAVGAGLNQFVREPGDKEDKAPRALFVGIDFERKGGDVLLDAWRIVREHVPDAELIVAGPTQTPRKDYLCGVKWMGPLDRGALAELYRSALVFVLPSLFEPWGLVFLEAMGHGLPCIGTSCCAMPEIIEDGVTGLLVPPGEAEPLALALIELLTEPDRAAAMGRAAHANVLRDNRWSNVVDRVAAHLSAG